MKKNMMWYAAGLLVVTMLARASAIVYNSVLVNETALAHNSAYPIDLLAVGVNTLSAQAAYSTATVPSVSFLDGTQSTGSISVLSFADLIAAQAADHITVVSTTGLGGALITLPGYTLKEGLDWKAGATTALSAESLKTALASVPFLSVSRSGSIVYTTATVGSYNNSLQMVSSTPTALTVATSQFSGGRDNASVRINGEKILQGREFTAITSNAVTATNLKNAINAAALLNTKLTAGASGALVTSTSTKAGTVFNYSMVSSTPTALSISGANMTGGTNPADTVGSATILAPSHGLTSALAVLYGTAGGTIGGLTNQTTYYVIPVDANSFQLASSTPLALAGTGIVVTSTSTQLSAHTFTLTPLAFTGIGSFKWQVSNDNTNWSDLAVSSVTVFPASAADSTLWSFGALGTRYLRLNTAAPTTGGLALRVVVIGTN